MVPAKKFLVGGGLSLTVFRSGKTIWRNFQGILKPSSEIATHRRTGGGNSIVRSRTS